MKIVLFDLFDTLLIKDRFDYEKALELVKKGIEIYPYMSEHAYSTDTRFGKAEDFVLEIEKIEIVETRSYIADVKKIKNVYDKII